MMAACIITFLEFNQVPCPNFPTTNGYDNLNVLTMRESRNFRKDIQLYHFHLERVRPVQQRSFSSGPGSPRGLIGAPGIGLKNLALLLLALMVEQVKDDKATVTLAKAIEEQNNTT